MHLACVGLVTKQNLVTTSSSVFSNMTTCLDRPSTYKLKHKKKTVTRGQVVLQKFTLNSGSGDWSRKIIQSKASKLLFFF